MKLFKESEKRKWKAFCLFSIALFFAALGFSFLVYTSRWEKALEAEISLEIQRKRKLEEFLRVYRSFKGSLIQFPEGKAPMDVLAYGLDRLKGRFPEGLLLSQGKEGGKGGIVFELQGAGTHEELSKVLTFLESFVFPVLLIDAVELTPFGCEVRYTIRGALKVPHGEV